MPKWAEAARLEKRREHCRHGREDIYGIHKRLEALVQRAYHETARGGHQWSMAIPSSTQDEHAICVSISALPPRAAHELELEHCPRL